jgi:hypothetical protein
MTIDWAKMFDKIEDAIKKNDLRSMHKLWKDLDLAEKEREDLPGEANAIDLEKITEGKKKLSDQILRLL